MYRKTHCLKGHLRSKENITSSGSCYQCHKEYNLSHTNHLYRQEYYKKNKLKILNYGRKSKLQNRYNLSIPEFNTLLLKQNSQCAICKIDQSSLSYPLCVDHNHKTGSVRGLLCFKCNAHILPTLETNPKLITVALEYLQTDLNRAT